MFMGSRMSEKVAVSSGSGQRQYKLLIFDLIDQKPIGCYMTFAAVCIIASESMILIFFRKRLFINKKLDYPFEQSDIISSFYNTLEILFECCFIPDRQHTDPPLVQ